MENYVTGLNKNLIIEKIKIKKNVNSHSTAKIRIRIPQENDAKNLESIIGSEVTIQNDTNILMRGCVSFVQIDYDYPSIFATVKLVSLTKKFDDKIQKRVFQSTDKKFADVFDKISSSDVNIDITEPNLKSKEYEGLIVQSNVTDFNFLIKVAKKLGYYVFINDTNSKPLLSVGNYVLKSSTELKEENMQKVSFSKDEFDQSLKIKSNLYYEIGTQMKVLSSTYTIISMKIVVFDRQFSYHYTYNKDVKSKEKDYCDTNFYNLGNCKVVSRDDDDKLGRIQVEFSDFEDSLSNKRAWINYLPNLTEGDVGVLTYPDKDEIVRVFSYDGNFFVVGCVREKEINKDFDDTQHRHIKFREKELTFTKDVLKLVSKDSKVEIDDDNLKIETNEETGIETKNIKFKAETQAQIDTKTLNLKSSDTSNLEANSLNLKANSNTKIESLQTTINSTSKVDVKTTTFNVSL